MAMGLDLISGVFAAAATHWVVNGLPIEATYLKSESSGCAMAGARAAAWRKAGKAVVEQRIEKWCVVGTVIERYWVSEQWQASPVGSVGAFGWRVRLPLLGRKHLGHSSHLSWPIDLVDPAISARIQFRSSQDNLDTHHQKTLSAFMADGQSSKAAGTPISNLSPLRISRLNNGELVISGSSPSARYSVVIQRIGER